MSVNTLVKDGILSNIEVPVTILDTGDIIGDEHKNPGLCRDPEGNTWISIRSCVITPDRWEGYEHPNHYQNYLHLGKLDESTLKISGLKVIEPEEQYTGFQWGIEDVRLFWREDGLHGVGVIIPIAEGKYKLRLAEILIDYETGKYKLLKDLGRPFGHAEKNWSPSEQPNEHFDYVYSPTQIVKDGEVIGEYNDLFIHNGTPLIHFEDGYLAIAHAVVNVKGERTYAQLALKHDKYGKVTHHSQFFHFNVGWRQGLKETVEFGSGLLWSPEKEGKEMTLGFGVKDELIGIAKIDVSKLRWETYSDTMWYAWQWETPPNRVEIPNEPMFVDVDHQNIQTRQLEPAPVL